MRQVAARAGGQLGVDRTTLLNHVGPARAAGFAPGGPPMGEGDWRTLVTGWFPELSDTGLATIHQRLSDERGLDASVASVRRWVRANLARGRPPGPGRGAARYPAAGFGGADRLRELGMWFDPDDDARCGRSPATWAPHIKASTGVGGPVAFFGPDTGV